MEAKLRSLIEDASTALQRIVSDAEKFTCWNDVCGRKIDEMLASAVQDAVDDNIKIDDLEADLNKILNDITPAIRLITEEKGPQ